MQATGFAVASSFRHFVNHFPPKKSVIVSAAMSETKTRQLTRDYLAAVDKALSALDRAKNLRAALRRELARRGKGERRGKRAPN
jgi:hypothetical protein